MSVIRCLICRSSSICTAICFCFPVHRYGLLMEKSHRTPEVNSRIGRREEKWSILSLKWKDCSLFAAGIQNNTVLLKYSTQLIPPCCVVSEGGKKACVCISTCICICMQDPLSLNPVGMHPIWKILIIVSIPGTLHSKILNVFVRVVFLHLWKTSTSASV